jgi:hypothetical protein
MFGFLPAPQYIPCPDCGAAVEAGGIDAHECDRERLIAYQMLLVSHEVRRFEWEFRLWLLTPAGRFAAYWAERERRRGASV